MMNTHTATEARSNLYSLIDEANQSHEPIYITGKRGNAVLIGEEDFRAISETLYLLSVPGLRQDLVNGMKQDPKKLSKKLNW
jgi:prevent-host-death family protein